MRPRCSADGDSPADDDEGFTTLESSSGTITGCLDDQRVEFLVPVALVAFVREDVLDHAIWTGAVVSHPVVADHHRHHSLELE